MRQEAATECPRCGRIVCGRHKRSCELDGTIRCDSCVLTTPLHDGSYCIEHMTTCRSCETMTPFVRGGLCDLCIVFAEEIDDELPFQSESIESFVRENAGAIRRFAKVRRRLGEKLALVWVRSSVLRRDAVAVFDHEGNRVPGIVPHHERLHDK